MSQLAAQSSTPLTFTFYGRIFYVWVLGGWFSFSFIHFFVDVVFFYNIYTDLHYDLITIKRIGRFQKKFVANVFFFKYFLLNIA